MSKTHVFVGTEKGAFILTSDAARGSWSMHGPVLKGWKVQDIAVDTRNGAPRLFAAVGSYVYAACVHTSDDLGKTWSQKDTAPEFDDNAAGKLNALWTLVPGHASRPNEIFAGVADAGIFRSPDNGDSWEELRGLSEHETRSGWEPGAGGMCCHTILVHPENPDRMWVGISAVGVFRTDDAGKTWDLKNDGLEIIIEPKEHKGIGSCVHRVTLDPRNPDRLFQQNHRGLFRSLDGADTWERVEDGLPAPKCFGFPIAMDPNDSDTLFIVPQESDEYRMARDGLLTVYRTKDACASWQPTRDGLPDDAYVGVLRQAMATDANNPCGVYFGTTGGEVHYSTDAGDSWATFPYRFPRIGSISTWTES